MLGTCWCGPLLAQSFSPYADFQAMSLTDLATLQVKITYAGKQRHSHRSLIITATGHQPNMALFSQYLRPGVNYFNDVWPPLTFTATAGELKALVDGVGLLPSVTDGDVDPGGYVSFALSNTAGGTAKVFEAVLNEATGALVFDKLLNSLQANATGRKMVWEFGSRSGTVPGRRG